MPNCKKCGEMQPFAATFTVVSAPVNGVGALRKITLNAGSALFCFCFFSLIKRYSFFTESIPLIESDLTFAGIFVMDKLFSVSSLVCSYGTLTSASR